MKSGKMGRGLLSFALTCCATGMALAAFGTNIRQTSPIHPTTGRAAESASNHEAPSATIDRSAAFTLAQALQREPGSNGGGNFRGDPCSGSIYSNIEYDGENGLGSCRRTGLNFRTADDVTFTRDANVTGVSFYAINTDDFNWNSRLDLLILNNDGTGGRPGTTKSNASNLSASRTDTGDVLFDLTVWLYELGGRNTDLAADTYWFMIRPIGTGSTGASYNATAPVVDSPVYFSNNNGAWQTSSEAFGADYDVAFCVIGKLSGDPTGACCASNGDCSQLTKAECSSAGGTYRGDGTDCSPNECPGAPGACCLADGNCVFVKEVDCEGDFQGVGVNCSTGLCPIPDPCPKAIYTNIEYDGNNGLTSERSNAFGGIESFTADDIPFDRKANIEGVSFIALTSAEYEFNGTGDLIILAADGPGGAPETELFLGTDLTCSGVNTGDSLFGFPVILYRIDGLNINLDPGTYFLGARPVGNGSADGARSFWATAPWTGASAYLRGVAFGFPDWTSWEDVPNGGGAQDVAFCVNGTLSGGVSGKCCFDDGSCEVITSAECSSRGGDYGGDGSNCSPNLCPGAPGACCLDSGECVFVKPGDCDGGFQGEGVPCTGGLCPIPPACENPLYDNLAFDGVNALTSERSALVTSYTADDFTTADTVKLTGFGWLSTTDVDYEWNGLADAIVLAANGPGGAPGTVIQELLDLSAERVDTGFVLFGTNLYQYRISSGVDITVAAGTYYVGLRPVGDGSGRNFWATAPLLDNEAYLKSDDFGFPDWTAWSDPNLLGIQTDVAMCVNGESTQAVGACCVGSTCTQETSSGCASKGGTYKGNNTSCFPNPCPNAPGACCLENETCVFVSQNDCNSQGGSFLGVDIECNEFKCVKDRCVDPVYNNGQPDGANALASEIGDEVGIDAETADDFTLNSAATLSGANYYAITFDEYDFNGTTNVAVYLADGTDGAPGTTVSSSSAPTDRILSGVLFGIPLYQYTVSSLDIDLDAGTVYFISLVPVAAGEDGFEGASFWATAPTNGEGGAWFRSEFFGFPDWTPWSEVLADGTDPDVAFCLLAGALDPCSGVVCGDSDGNGFVDFDDIDCFVAALISQGNWEGCGTQYPADAYLCANDTDKNGSVDFDDIDPFVTAIIDGACP